MKNPIVNMFVAHYHFWFLKFRDRDKACHTALLFIALMLTLFETTVLLLVGGRFLQLFLNMGAAVLILALAANMAAYYFLLRLAFTPERAVPSGKKHLLTGTDARCLGDMKSCPCE